MTGNEELLPPGQAAREYFADIVVGSWRGEAHALSDLFAMSQTGLDGAAAEGYAAYLGRALYAAGDTRFGGQLAKESPEVQRAIRGDLCFDLGLPGFVRPYEIQSRFPITFPANTLVFEYESDNDDPWKGGGFTQVLAEEVGNKFGKRDQIPPIVDLEYVRIPWHYYQLDVYVVSYDWEKDWWGSWDVVAETGGEIEWVASIDEKRSIKDKHGGYEPLGQSIDSVRVVFLEGQYNPFIEVIDTTHMGHGSLYLYELNHRSLRLVLATDVLDRHEDQTLILDGGVLKREYKDFNGDGYTDMRLAGTGAVLKDRDDEDREKQTIGLQKGYLWSPEGNHFVTNKTQWKWFE